MAGERRKDSEDGEVNASIRTRTTGVHRTSHHEYRDVQALADHLERLQVRYAR